MRVSLPSPLWQGGGVPRRLFISFAAVVLLAGCASAPTSPSPTTAPPAATGTATTGTATTGTAAATGTGAPAGTTTCQYTLTYDAARPVDLPDTTGVPTTGTVSVTFTMTEGDVTLTLDRAHAPCTVNSFLSLAEQDFYTGTACHRLVDSRIFVLQCGDPTGTGSGGPGYVFADETHPDDTFPRGTLAMANSGTDSNGSQFFFVYQDSDLPPKYTVFGHLDEASLSVIDRMAVEGQDGTNPAGGGRPNNPSAITAVRLG